MSDAVPGSMGAFRQILSIICIMALMGSSAFAAASDDPAKNCRYREAAVSLPAVQVSSAEVGHPWRAIYGYCLRGGKRFVLHQDWSLSYLHAKPRGGFSGGDGAAIGTDVFLRWHPDWRPSILPYLEIGMGVQYAIGTPFPADGSRWMLTQHAGPGWLIPLRRNRQASIAIRYLHLSNAGLLGENSGYDVVHLVLGFRWGKATRPAGQ